MGVINAFAGCTVNKDYHPDRRRQDNSQGHVSLLSWNEHQSTQKDEKE